MEHLKISDQVSHTFERLALIDPSPSVRAMALSALGRIYRGQEESRIAAMFARIVANTSLSLEERKCGYVGLVLVNGDGERFSIPAILLGFPESIDWDFVQSCLLQTE
jgi:hypothetical protein